MVTVKTHLRLEAEGVVELHPTGLPDLYLPSLDLIKNLQRQWQRHKWFNG